MSDDQGDTNHFVLEGEVCGAPVVKKYGNDGKDMVTVWVRTTRSFHKKDGERIEETADIECAIFGNDVKAAKGLLFGNRVEVEGRLGARVYDPKDGRPAKTYLQLRIQSLKLIGGAINQPDAPKAQTPDRSPPPAQANFDDSEPAPF